MHESGAFSDVYLIKPIPGEFICGKALEIELGVSKEVIGFKFKLLKPAPFVFKGLGLPLRTLSLPIAKFL